MRRIVLDALLDWKKVKNRKVLLLRGARHVGKTFIVRELAKEFNHFVGKSFFEQNLNPARICTNLSTTYSFCNTCIF